MSNHELRDRVEDEIDLAVKEVVEALAILRKIKKELEKTGKDPEKLALVIALIRALERRLTKLGEISLARLGQTSRVMNAIVGLRKQRKALDKLVNDGLARVKNLEKAKGIVKALGDATAKLKKLTA